MKKVIQMSATLLVSLLLAQVAVAEPAAAPAAGSPVPAAAAPATAAVVGIDAIKTSLMTARENLVAMLDAADAATQDKHQAEITKATQGVDDGVTTSLADKGTSAEQAAKLEAFKQVWGEFKKTRDEEIIPAIKAGKKDEAKQLATTIQADRMKNMKGILAELGAQPDPTPTK